MPQTFCVLDRVRFDWVLRDRRGCEDSSGDDSNELLQVRYRKGFAVRRDEVSAVGLFHSKVVYEACRTGEAPELSVSARRRGALRAGSSGRLVIGPGSRAGGALLGALSSRIPGGVVSGSAGVGSPSDDG